MDNVTAGGLGGSPFCCSFLLENGVPQQIPNLFQSYSTRVQAFTEDGAIVAYCDVPKKTPPPFTFSCPSLLTNTPSFITRICKPQGKLLVTYWRLRKIDFLQWCDTMRNQIEPTLTGASQPHLSAMRGEGAVAGQPVGTKRLDKQSATLEEVATCLGTPVFHPLFKFVEHPGVKVAYLVNGLSIRWTHIY